MTSGNHVQFDKYHCVLSEAPVPKKSSKTHVIVKKNPHLPPVTKSKNSISHILIVVTTSSPHLTVMTSGNHVQFDKYCVLLEAPVPKKSSKTHVIVKKNPHLPPVTKGNNFRSHILIVVTTSSHHLTLMIT